MFRVFSGDVPEILLIVLYCLDDSPFFEKYVHPEVDDVLWKGFMFVLLFLGTNTEMNSCGRVHISGLNLLCHFTQYIQSLRGK